jgi:hypothetical protein
MGRVNAAAQTPAERVVDLGHEVFQMDTPMADANYPAPCPGTRSSRHKRLIALIW